MKYPEEKSFSQYFDDILAKRIPLADLNPDFIKIVAFVICSKIQSITEKEIGSKSFSDIKGKIAEARSKSGEDLENFRSYVILSFGDLIEYSLGNRERQHKNAAATRIVNSCKNEKYYISENILKQSADELEKESALERYIDTNIAYPKNEEAFLTLIGAIFEQCLNDLEVTNDVSEPSQSEEISTATPSPDRYTPSNGSNSLESESPKSSSEILPQARKIKNNSTDSDNIDSGSSEIDESSPSFKNKRPRNSESSSPKSTIDTPSSSPKSPHEKAELIHDPSIECVAL